MYKILNNIVMSTIFIVLLFSSSVGLASTYYVDFQSGSDSNNGTSIFSPFAHCPGDGNATGNSASTKLNSGDIIYFKKGITYEGQITVGQSGTEPSSGTTGSINNSGNFIDYNADFFADGVIAGDYLYIYNNSIDGSYIESVGLWRILSVDSVSQLTLDSFTGREHGIAELPYKIYRPITFTSLDTWGSGEAIITGAGVRNYHFDLNGKNYIRIAGLKLIDLRDVPDDNCNAPRNRGAIWSSNNDIGIIIENVSIHNVWSAMQTDYLKYSVIRNNNFDIVDSLGITCGDWALVENNIINDVTRGLASCRKYPVIRHNLITNVDHIASQACGLHADGMQFFSASAEPGSAKYGWIYGNTITNVSGNAGAQLIYLTSTNGGTSNWTIHSNVLIGSQDGSGGGDHGIYLRKSVNAKIYNNIFFAINNSRGFNNQLKISEGSTNADVKNNIFYGGNEVLAGGIHVDASSVNGFVSDGNMYYYPNRPTAFMWAGNLKTWAEWQALQNDNTGNSFWNVAPKFIDILGSNLSEINLRLQSDSPARDTPFSLSVTTRDADSNLWIANSRWDRGAYKYDVIPPEPPQNLHSLAH